MKKIALSILAFCLIGTATVFAQDVEKQLIVKDRKNDKHQTEKPYVILVSLDGFRFDYVDKHDAQFLRDFSKMGVSAESMFPSFPSVTFPNHYTIVTGLYPAHHGLVGNNMFERKMGDRYSLGNTKAVKDQKWYGGTPLWVLAEQQGMLSACYYWPGSEANIQDVYPTYSYAYSEKTDIKDRLEQVDKWLKLPKEYRPHFITFYMPEVDHAGHTFGPDATETRDAVQQVDIAMTELFKIVENSKLPVNIIIVSDHGMISLDQETLLKLPIEVDAKEMDVVSNGTYMSVFVKDPGKTKFFYEKLLANADSNLMEVYLSEQLPDELYFNRTNDRFDRLGDIVVLAKSPYYFTNKPLAGSHGYDPKEVKEMRAIFMAYGPNFEKGKQIEAFSNVHIYPLIAKILGLNYDASKIDGSEEVLKSAYIKN